MPNVRAFRSGNWSDTNPATSPWGTGGVLYAPASNDDVFSNNFTIQIDQDVAVLSITNDSATSRLWKDGATTTATRGGTFNLLDGVTFTGNCTGSGGGTTTGALTLSGTNSATVVGVIRGTSTADGGNGIMCTGSGQLFVTGTVQGGVMSGTNNARGINATLNCRIIVTGNVIGGTGTNSNFSYNTAGINLGVGSSLVVIGNVTGGSSGIIGPGIYDNSGGMNRVVIVGNFTATSTNNAFVSFNSNSYNIISGNIFNNPNGTAAFYATRFLIDPIPTNGVIQYSHVNMFTTDSLSAFSMPPVSTVRSGTLFANNTLMGICRIPSPNSVSINVPVDNTVGNSFLTPPVDFFNFPVSSLTASNSLGARLTNCSTIDGVGRIISSFSK